MNYRSSSKQPLVLASASPRRRQLLQQSGVGFEVIVSGIDETRLQGEAAENYALRLACAKARAVAQARPSALVLGADTVVEAAGHILGKPLDRGQARWMIGLLSGRAHRVITGFALVADQVLVEAKAVVSEVTFRALGVREIEDYIATDEPYDKAGAYAVQGQGRSLIAGVRGSIANVMGLPIEEVLAALARYDPPLGF